MDSSRPPQPTGLSNTNHSTHQYQTFVTAEPEAYESTEDSQTRRAWKSALSIRTLPVADEDDSDSEDEYGPTSRQRLKRNTVSPLLLPSTPIPEHRPTVRASLIARLQLSSIQKNILKCAVAYFIASLFTFNKTLASFLGQPFDIEGATPNAHFIATVSVYYNRALLNFRLPCHALANACFSR